MKVLVTGATGFLGSWLTRKLCDLGLDVRILHRPSSSLANLSGLNVEYYTGDITSPLDLTKAVTDVDTVFHVAGLIGYKRSQRHAMESINVNGTQNVVTACRTQKVRRLVHISTVCAIGAGFDAQTILNEDAKFNLHHLNLSYFESKRKAEECVRRAVKNNEVDAVILNPATIYGPGDALKGSRQVQSLVARGKMPFYTSGGVSVVDVNSVVNGIVSAWQKGRTGERYILAGENVTIKQLFYMIAELANVPPPTIFFPDFLVHGIGNVGSFFDRFGFKVPFHRENSWAATLYHWFDATKARTELGFSAISARQAIATSVAWSKERGLI